MNKPTTFILIIIIFASLLLSFVSLAVISTYLLTGLNKDSFIAILQLIPSDIFWMVGLPAFIMCFTCTCYLMWKFIKLGTSHPKDFKLKVKKVYHLDDIDLGQKLSDLINETDDDNENIPEKFDDDVKDFSSDVKTLGIKIWKLPDYIVTFPERFKKLCNRLKSLINRLSIRFVDYLTMKSIDIRIRTNSKRKNL